MLPELKDNYTFNIIGFGQTLSECFETPQEPTDGNISIAKNYIDNMYGDLGIFVFIYIMMGRFYGTFRCTW